MNPVKREKGEGDVLSFFALVFLVIFFCLLQFNNLPSDQFSIAVVLILYILIFVAAPSSLLSVVRNYPKLSCLFLFGATYLVISALSYSHWPWLSLWLGASLIFLPATVLGAMAFRNMGLLDLLAGFIAAVVINTFAIIFLSYQGVQRPGGFLEDPNLAANFCALGILSTLFLIQRSPRNFLYLIQFLLGLGLFLTFSRGASLALAGAALIYLILSQIKNTQCLKPFLFSCIAIVAAYFASLTIFSVEGGGAGLSLNARPESMADRLDMWHSAWLMFLEAPFWGTGIGTFALRYPEFRKFTETSSAGFFAHNDYLQLLAELGAFGFLIWFAVPVTLFVLCVKTYVKSVRPEAVSASCLAISLMSLVAAQSVVNFIMYHPLINVLLGGVSGCVIAQGQLSHMRLSGAPSWTFTSLRAVFGVLLLVVGVTFTADFYSRKLEGDLEEGTVEEFNVRSEYYYDFLALKYFSPLNVEIRNRIVEAELNTALNLLGTPFGKDLMDQILGRINRSSWLHSRNCQQQVFKARLIWVYEQDEAIDLLRKLLNKNPSCIKGRITLAEAFIATGQYEKSINLLNHGIDRFVFRENSGDGPTVLLETLINAYRLDGQFENANALKIYVEEFKREREQTISPKWYRYIQF